MRIFFIYFKWCRKICDTGIKSICTKWYIPVRRSEWHWDILKLLFFVAYFFYWNLFIVFNAYFKSLIKKVWTSLRCPYYYLLLLMKKIVVNITDFPAPLKIYKKKFLIESHVKILDRNYWYARFWKKLLKFLQGVMANFSNFRLILDKKW